MTLLAMMKTCGAMAAYRAVGLSAYAEKLARHAYDRLKERTDLPLSELKKIEKKLKGVNVTNIPLETWMPLPGGSKAAITRYGNRLEISTVLGPNQTARGPQLTDEMLKGTHANAFPSADLSVSSADQPSPMPRQPSP